MCLVYKVLQAFDTIARTSIAAKNNAVLVLFLKDLGIPMLTVEYHQRLKTIGWTFSLLSRRSNYHQELNNHVKGMVSLTQQKFTKKISRPLA